MNFAAKRNFAFLRELLQKKHRPVVLIVGGAEVGAGLADLLEDNRITFIETDVVIGHRTQVVCDAGFLPFQTESLDGTIAQAVLEYVSDPGQCVSEIHRVLKSDGIVYSEMPFLQCVHGGGHDFQRLTHLGHRRLFRNFSEIRSGPCAGPATALAWSIQQFFLSFVVSQALRDMVKLGVASSLFWLKYFDHFLANTPGGLDGSTGTYMMMRKGTDVLTDRDLISQYRGAVRSQAII